MSAGKSPGALSTRFTGDAGEYLDRVGVFLRRKPAGARSPALASILQ
jgi:hypothetical protein